MVSSEGACAAYYRYRQQTITGNREEKSLEHQLMS